MHREEKREEGDRGDLEEKLSRFSHVQLCATPWTAAYQVPPSMGFSRQEYWSGLPLPSSQEEKRGNQEGREQASQ